MARDKISPDVRRLVMQYAAWENIAYAVAVECLILEGIKSLCSGDSTRCPVVHKTVDNRS